MKNLFKNKKGFTLIELVVVISILGILAAIAVPRVAGYIDSTRIAVDQVTVKTLNNATNMYRINVKDSDSFKNESFNSNDLLQKLVDNGYLSKFVTPLTKDAAFVWLFKEEKWHLLFEDSFYVITNAEGVYISSIYGRLEGLYTGTAKDIVIPNTLGGFTVKYIYQDVFRGKNLTTVTFEEGNEIKRIHARAFYNNQLNDIVFPAGLERIDLWAFRGNNLTEVNFPASLQTIEQRAFDNNNITKITIGDNVSIGSAVFKNNNDGFVEVYSTGGAGTYLFIDGNWVKQ